MFESAEFETKQGKPSERPLILFALTTCGFCKKARAFLDEQGFAYDFLYMDRLDPTLKKGLKEEFSRRFGKRLTYPTLIVGGEEILTGFIRVAWEEELLGNA